MRGFGVLESLDHLMRTVESQAFKLEDQTVRFDKSRKESQSEMVESKVSSSVHESNRGVVKRSSRLQAQKRHPGSQPLGSGRSKRYHVSSHCTKRPEELEFKNPISARAYIGR